MNIDTPASAADSSTLSAHTATGFDVSGQGYLVLDRLQRVIHVSEGLQAVLRLHDKVPLQGVGVMDLLEIAFGLETVSLCGIEQWLTPPVLQAIQEKTGPLVLLTANDARTVECSRVAIGEEYRIVSFHDSNARLDAQSEMEVIAHQDRLTGIGNRSLFEYRLDRTLARLTAGEVDGATVFFLDLDRFKMVNDSLGHAVGDILLRLVAERLQSVLHDSDILARLGGDEFAIMLDRSCGKVMASALAKQMIDLIQRPYLIDGEVVHVGASMGIASAPANGLVGADLLKNADLALYHSKAAGRGIFHFFQPAMAEKVIRRRALEADLRKALVLRQFELHYQPQIDVADGNVIGLEGLLRWRHPQRGIMLPCDFLALAEEIGLAVPIGKWALKTACEEAKRWPGTITVAVNISSLQFEMRTFAELVEQALVSAHLPGYRLEIEVNEDILLRDGETVRATLGDLRALGVRVAMDSFGTGIASLSQLVNFPFDKIKIDRSLIDMHHDASKHRAIVRAICALGQSLGISTLAEGVKTSQQLADVQSDGCDSVQGFYYSEAVPSDKLMDLFSKLATVAGPCRVPGKGAA